MGNAAVAAFQNVYNTGKTSEQQIRNAELENERTQNSELSSLLGGQTANNEIGNSLGIA